MHRVTYTGTREDVYAISRYYLLDYCHQLGPDLTKVLDGYIRSRNLRGLAEASDLFDTSKHCIEVRRHLSQISSFFKKNVIFSEPSVCERAARSAFLKAERVCAITNKRMDYYFSHQDRLNPVLLEQLARMERFITRVLGDYDGFFEDLPRRIRVTPGASATRSRRKSLPFMKVTMKPECTPRAVPYVKALYSFFGYSEPRPRTSLWNRVEAVPKNWKTYRTIACEPTHNVPLQLAFDDYVKSRLRRVGVNLLDQSLNQELARIGSVDGTLCTVDLSAASDTLALNVIHWLFPEPWARYLLDIRSPYYKMDGQLHKYSKFSSMGNGTTFGLESLVFAACCVALQPRTYSVYGDDIIIDTDKYEDLERLLRFLGFSLNSQKSYHEGPFRESCGADWFEGRNITPFYLRKWSLESRERPNLCHNVNGLVSVALPGGLLWNSLRDLCKSLSLPLVPYNEASTSGIFVDITRAHNLGLFNYNVRDREGWVMYKSFVSKTRKMYIPDSRTLFLWYLDRYRNDRELSPKSILEIDGVVVRSEVPTLRSKYVRKWVNWIPPVGGEPVHLYWWTDDLTSG